jgi:hypothetical protein
LNINFVWFLVTFDSHLQVVQIMSFQTLSKVNRLLSTSAYCFSFEYDSFFLDQIRDIKSLSKVVTWNYYVW